MGDNGVEVEAATFLRSGGTSPHSLGVNVRTICSNESVRERERRREAWITSFASRDVSQRPS